MAKVMSSAEAVQKERDHKYEVMKGTVLRVKRCILNVENAKA